MRIGSGDFHSAPAGVVKLMKKRTLIFLLGLGYTCAVAQGWVNFMNSPSTLFSVKNPDGTDVVPNGTYYFSLLAAPTGVVDFSQFTLTGLYATNQATAGRFFGGTFLEAPSWPVGTAKAFLIAGWSASLGSAWNSLWLNGDFSGSGFFGLSAIGAGVAGGIIDPNSPPLPPLNLFGGSAGLQSGFSLYPVGIPEPSIAAIIAVGIVLVCCGGRRRTGTVF